MTNRERAMAVLHGEPVDRLPLVHFGFWRGETLHKWAAEGHVGEHIAREWSDGNPADLEVTELLGFDFNWQSVFQPGRGPRPGFEPEVVAELPDGSKHVRDTTGVVTLERPGAGSIPPHVDHLLKDRASWEEHYRRRYQWHEERVTKAMVRASDEFLRWDHGGLEFLQRDQRDYPYGLHCGSLYGDIRSLLGLEGACYLQVDDPPLFDEIIDTVADVCYRNVEYVLEAGARFDFGHFWEDICFKSGPLIRPDVFAEKVGPHYRRITDLLSEHGIDIVSLDCDGKIDALVPIWLENGVNTMFPIEVGVWGASIEPWRREYGEELRGVGGVDKRVFARDRAAVDAEIERIKPLVGLGRYLPCPDHRLAPDAEFELVRYYTGRMREEFG
ncbi:MAG: uroporphyrinogen decarboxylase family protein [Planctomycetota bacterium]